MFSLNDYLAGAGQGQARRPVVLRKRLHLRPLAIALNLKATQSLMEGNPPRSRPLIDAKDPPALPGPVRHGPQAIQQAVGYAVGFQEVVAENQQKLSNLSRSGAGGAPRPASPR